MKLSELKSNFKNTLDGLYPSDEIQSFFNILSEKYLNLSRIKIALNPELEIGTEDFNRFQSALLRLKEHEPIQYILGETEFYGLHFKVNGHTLIPRPETEELVEWIIKEQSLMRPDSHAPKILDIGTGSGCIAISLAKNLPNAIVHALDISSEALAIAIHNAESNKVKVDFFQTDIFQTRLLPNNFQNDIKYDIIVSNPPYVRELEKLQMQSNVLEYEPSTALFVQNEDPLVFYKTISQLAKNSLNPGGTLFFEINEHFGEELKILLEVEKFQKIEVKKDIYEKDRMLKCSFLK